MTHYTLSQWILFFFFYCFCGWLWESCYVSVRQRQWVNRGFLHGPLLPIYGSGALIILLATISVQQNLFLIFLLGMIAATILEYFTGAAMERLFQVRYWDYSSQPFNLNGHICLFCSLGWGVFSVLLVHFVHPPVARLIVRIPTLVSECMALGLTIYTTADAVQSFNAAMNLREMLESLAESNEEIRRIQKRAEVYYAFAEEDLQRLRDKVDEGRERIETLRRERSTERAVRQAGRRARMMEALRRRQAWKIDVLDTLCDGLEHYRKKLETATDLSAEAIAEKRAEIAEAMEKLQRQRQRIRTTSEKAYARADRILRGNPSATSRRFSEAIEELRKLSERK